MEVISSGSSGVGLQKLIIVDATPLRLSGPYRLD